MQGYLGLRISGRGDFSKQVSTWHIWVILWRNKMGKNVYLQSPSDLVRAEYGVEGLGSRFRGRVLGTWLQAYSRASRGQPSEEWTKRPGRNVWSLQPEQTKGAQIFWLVSL